MRVSQELEQWADCRNTSKEVAFAIQEIANGDGPTMQRIWCDPTTAEYALVTRLAFEIADDSDAVLYCGCETLVRHVIP